MKAKDLAEALYNAQQFSKETIVIRHDGGSIRVESYDGFTYVYTKVIGQVSGKTGVHYLTMDACKALQKALSALKDGAVYLTFQEGALEVDDQDEIIGYELVDSPGESDLQGEDLASLEELIHEAEINELAGLPAKLGNIAFSPDRFRKLSLLKPQGLPIDMSFESDAGVTYAAFKYGPSTVGLISFLDRTVIKEEMGPEYVW